MPKAPSSARPWTTRGGILPSRSIASESTSSIRNRSSFSRKARNSGRSGGASGNGWTRSRRKLPRKISFRKDGAFHSVSRASSATWRASAALTEGSSFFSAMEVEILQQTAPRAGAVYSWPRPVTNKYLSYDEERAPKVREMFSRLAWRYDLVNDVMSFGHAPALEAADGRPRARRRPHAAASPGPLLRQRRSELPGRGPAAPEASPGPTSRCRCSPSRGAAPPPERAPQPLRAGGRPRAALRRRELRRRHDRLRPAQHRRHPGGARGDAPRARARRPRRRPRLRQAGQRLAGALYQGLPQDR